jgi:flagellar hook-associated protein 2
MLSIDGITTGLDTSSIIEQLMNVERLPVTRLQAQQAKDDTKIAAWKAISTALDKVRTASAAVSTRFGLTSAVATSSVPTAVSVSAAATAGAGSLRFRVTQLATAEQRISSAGIGDPGAVAGDGRIAIGVGLGGAGITALTPEADATAGVYAVRVTAGPNDTVELSVGPLNGEGESVTVDSSETSASVGGLTFSFAAGALTAGTARVVVGASSATTTVSQLASSLSTTGSPVSARILSLSSPGGPVVGNADNRVVLAAQDTGTANTMLVGSTGLNASTVAAFGTTNVVSAAQDAIIRVGSPGQDVAVQRASNTVTDVFDGLTLNLLQADTNQEVVVQVNRDIDGLAKKVTDWVDSVNAALASIDSKASYDADTKTAGPLLSEASARTMRDTLVRSLTEARAADGQTVLSQIGIAIGVNGRFAVDQTVLKKALTDNPDTVTSLLAQQGTATADTVAFDGATGATKPGTYAVVITQAPAQATVTGAEFEELDADETITVRVGAREVSYDASAGDTIEQVVDGLRAAMSSAGLAATIEITDGAITLRSTAFGAAAVLGVRSSVDGSTPGSSGFGGADPEEYAEYTGTDVAGTIDGVAATGSGRTLTAASGDAAGLRLRISADAPGNLGTITFASGAAGSSNALLGADGYANTLLTSAMTSAQQHKQRLQTTIDRYESRMAMAETRYRKQFTALETMLSQLQSQGTALTSLIKGLPSNARQNG